jgi:hypothetical protein
MPILWRMNFLGKSKLPLVLVIGAGGGFLSGMAGVGGAVILIPLMVAWLGVSQRQAQGNSLWVIVVTAAAAAARYAVSTPVDLRIAAAIAITGIVFGVVGANIAERVDPDLLRRFFGFLLLVAALRMTLSVAEPTFAGSIGASVPVAIGLGAGAGLIAGLLGVGGGIVVVPGSVILLGLPQIEAQALSLFVMVPITLSAAITNWRFGNIDWGLTVPMVAAATVASIIGSGVALALPTHALEILFPILLIYFAQRMLGVQAWLVRKLGARDEYS